MSARKNYATNIKIAFQGLKTEKYKEMKIYDQWLSWNFRTKNYY